ncbi:PadR family transcriptional regulator [Lacrimispora saccharolytica]|uniref:Transcriptional regulator, PadR-like family n=1 Tax=Lacrimispora saccharolytica (strain ATCC 35040 / DSM 2544 / NRCC 2533 / WM1) TaxID=610130 RepID=D9R5M4_LACSW|nr:PadR family transcriptional regulator [Lacrimispora saccharolytica]ADL05207.1 transcriptional regulator, PadR-like family [[Clostridium] saccharolyticum WM1]QRV20615.1 PadR family transcriptional regulator [Lacrimispora saccharolytica]
MKENTGKSKYVILGMLARMPQTGYTIKKWIENEYSHFWQESFGQIYPTLRKLVAEGLAVPSNQAPLENGRGQIQYSITDAGRRELSNWLREAPEVEKIRYEILLKISFGENTEPQVLLGHLEDFIKRNETLVQEMNRYIELSGQLKEKEIDCSFSQLTALCGVYIYSAMRDWAVEAKRIIAEKGDDQS